MASSSCDGDSADDDEVKRGEKVTENAFVNWCP